MLQEEFSAAKEECGNIIAQLCSSMERHLHSGQYENAAFNNILSVGRLQIVENIMMLH